MAFDFGYFSEFSDSVTFHDPVMMAVAKSINLGPFQGAFYQAMGALPKALTQKAFEVYTRSQTSRDGETGDAWDADDVTGLSVNADVLKGLTVGHVLEFGYGGEVVIVKSVNRAAGTIDVYARGAGSSTAAAHDAGAQFQVIGYAGNDDDLEKVDAITEITSQYENYVQTIYEVMKWKKHGELARKGLESSGEITMLIEEGQIRIAIMLARMAIRGKKQRALDDDDRYMSAGLLEQLTDTNGGKRAPFSYNVNGELTEDKLHDAIIEVCNSGGVPDTIWCNTTVKGYINKFNMANSALAINANRSDHVAGSYITHVDVDGLILPVRMDSDIPGSVVAVVKQGDCKKGWLEGDGLRMTDEPESSSRKKRKAMQGSVGFLVENVGVNHTLLTGITGGPPERVYKTMITNPGIPVSVTNESAIPVSGTVNVGNENAIPVVGSLGAVKVSEDPAAASAENSGQIIMIETGWEAGTAIETAVAGEFWASNGTAWVKLG